MSETLSRVPPEFQGRARLYYDSLVAPTAAAEAINRASKKMTSAWCDSRRGKKTFRTDHFVEVARLWRQLPKLGELVPPEIAITKKSLAIRAFRLGISRAGLRDWKGETERTILALETGVIMVENRCEHDGGVLVAVSAHALARRYQRGFGGSSDLDLKFDFMTLLNHYVTAKINRDRVGQSVIVPVVGGEYRCVVKPYSFSNGRMFVCLDARTYV